MASKRGDNTPLSRLGVERVIYADRQVQSGMVHLVESKKNKEGRTKSVQQQRH
jgi:hypothetical protein